MSGPRLPAFGVTVVALALLAPPTVVIAPVIASGKAMVQNNTSERLTCRYRIGSGAWSATFEIAPAAEFHRPNGANVQLFCEPPVRRIVYRVRPGERYSLLRAANGLIELRRITVDG